MKLRDFRQATQSLPDDTEIEISIPGSKHYPPSRIVIEFKKTTERKKHNKQKRKEG